MTPLLQIVLIIVISTLCQIGAWRTKIPSILLLLIAGLLLGPAFMLITPDAVFGAALLPCVELAVAVILFEGGLSLKRTELGVVGPVVLRLITGTAALTWALLSLGAYFILNLSAPISLVLGAILVVSGPTVIIPLLRTIRARASIEPVLRWEGILIDPVGVILAVLVAEVAEAGIGLFTPWYIGTGIAIGLLVGFICGWGGAWVLQRVVGRHLLPDQLVVPFTLAILFGAVTFANGVHEHSGLLTSTVMGLLLAREQDAWLRSVEDFIGHIQTMFVGVLFVVLAARLDPATLQYFNLSLLGFIATAIFVVRPFAVFLATTNSGLSWRQRFAASALAPRGIVSAALASSLSAPLVAAQVSGAETIVPYTFATIIGTVAFYGSFGPILFRLMAMQQQAHEGVLFVGAGTIARAIGKAIRDKGFRVVFVDTNESNIRRAREEAFEAHLGNILSDSLQEQLSFEGVGNLLAFTSNGEANAIAAVEFRNIFGAAHVFNLAPPHMSISKRDGRIFSDRSLSWERFEDLWLMGYRPIVRELDDQETPQKSNGEQKIEFVLAEIEGERLFIAGDDKLRRASKPSAQIVFAAEL